MSRALDTMSLGDRMKEYEDAYRVKMPRRMPVILRLDGKAFHTWTKDAKLERPFDKTFLGIMALTMKYLVDNIQGAVFAYTQSDEISILLRNYDSVNTDPWFSNNVQKIVSVASAFATGEFNRLVGEYMDDVPLAFFDARAFVIPKDEVVNYFIWRQQDASRNSVRSVATHYLGHKNVVGKNNNEVQDMLMGMDIPVNWNDFPIYMKRGCCYNALAKQIDEYIPIFSASREYVALHIEKLDEPEVEVELPEIPNAEE